MSAKDLNICEKYIKTAEPWSISSLCCTDVKDSIDRCCMCCINEDIHLSSHIMQLRYKHYSTTYKGKPDEF
jgi:hypothetical protein